MSTGNIKCKLYGNCNLGKEHHECTTACENYNPKNENENIEIPAEVLEQEEKKFENTEDINLKLSGLGKFDKKYEFIIIKKHIFVFQNISPKKIILKYKRKLNKTDNIADGCYIFVDKDDNLLSPHKVFAKFDRDAKNTK